MSKKIWIDYKSDLVSGTTCLSQGVCFGDIYNDGDYKIACGDLSGKLKILKQECLINESKLNYCPVSVIVFKGYDKQLKSIYQYLAVAGLSYIYIYKNMKGILKLVIPNIEINSLELKIWDDLKLGNIDHRQAKEKLKDMLDKSKFLFIERNWIINKVIRFFKY